MYKLNLILDLDETLIYTVLSDSTNEPRLKLYDYVLSFDANIRNSSQKYYLFLRPYLILFLKEVSKYYNLILYTNAMEYYTLNIVNYINYCIFKTSNYSIFKAIYFRYPNMTNIKSLKRIQEVNSTITSNNTIIIDDNIYAWNDTYYKILYKIPAFNLINYNYTKGNDNILNILCNDLIIYYNNKHTNQLNEYNILSFN